MASEIGQPWRWSKDGETDPSVGIVTGSITDVPKITPVYTTLEDLEIPYEVDITSAHRMPDLMAEYSKQARKRGLQVLITIAGGSAALPGMAAAYNHLPVIGVGVGSSPESRDQSEKSQVGMPPGAALNYVGAGSGSPKNAALSAAEILALRDESLYERLVAYHEKMVAEVEGHRDQLRELGWRGVVEAAKVEKK